jgi:hypothetical protein
MGFLDSLLRDAKAFQIFGCEETNSCQSGIEPC